MTTSKISINFPKSPAKYKFVLLDDYSSVYLLAKAVEKYGAQNIDVVTPYTPEYNGFQSVSLLADKLGITTLRVATCDMPAVQRVALYNKLSAPIQKEDTSGGVLSGGDKRFVVYALIPLLMSANILLPNGEVNTSQDRSTLAVATTADLREQLNLNFTAGYAEFKNVLGYTSKDTGPLWTPLDGINLTDLFTAAREENILDILLAVRSCKTARPYRCGVCEECRPRRQGLFESGIEDPTFYELA